MYWSTYQFSYRSLNALAGSKHQHKLIRADFTKFTKWKSVSMSLCLCLLRANACTDLYENWYVDQYMS